MLLAYCFTFEEFNKKIKYNPLTFICRRVLTGEIQIKQKHIVIGALISVLLSAISVLTYNGWLRTPIFMLFNK